jgi:flavin-dependent dehydrogenase
VQGALEAETIFAATGKHDLRDIPRRHTASDAVGMKMYFALASGAAKALDGAVELTLFPGGYAGMQHVENGHSVLCIAVQQPAFQGCGASWAGLVAMIEYRNRRFTAMLAGARALLPRPLAIAGIPYGYRALAVAPDGLYRLGDQAAVIPSLTGDGMAIALYSGRTGAEAWLAGKTSTEYHLSLAGILAPQMRLANLLHHACVNGFTQPMTLRFAERFPTLLRHAAVRTRIPAQHPASRT